MGGERKGQREGGGTRERARAGAGERPGPAGGAPKPRAARSHLPTPFTDSGARGRRARTTEGPLEAARPEASAGLGRGAGPLAALPGSFLSRRELAAAAGAGSGAGAGGGRGWGGGRAAAGPGPRIGPPWTTRRPPRSWTSGSSS